MTAKAPTAVWRPRFSCISSHWPASQGSLADKFPYLYTCTPPGRILSLAFSAVHTLVRWSCSHGSAYWQSGSQQLLMGLDMDLSPDSGLHHRTYLQLASPAVHQNTLGLTPLTRKKLPCTRGDPVVTGVQPIVRDPVRDDCCKCADTYTRLQDSQRIKIPQKEHSKLPIKNIRTKWSVEQWDRKYKKNQAEILELKNTITNWKISKKGYNNWLDQAEERINNFYGRSFEIIQRSKKKINK